MDLFLKTLVDSFLVPPGISLSLMVLGLTVYMYRQRIGLALMIFAALSLYVLSTAFMGMLLVNGISRYPPLSEAALNDSSVQAIVVLAGGRNSPAPEYGGDTVSALTLQRVRYGAWLKRRTNLPLLVTGGRVHGELESEAQLMQDVLQKEFSVAVEWVESQSRTTFENAKFSTTMLEQENIHKIYLVTQAWHMVRALEAFEHFNLEVIPAPTAFEAPGDNWPSVQDFFPSAMGLSYSSFALHEIIGRMWYHLKYY